MRDLVKTRNFRFTPPNINGFKHGDGLMAVLVEEDPNVPGAMSTAVLGWETINEMTKISNVEFEMLTT